MAPFVGSPLSSTQHALQVGQTTKAEARDVRGKLRMANFDHTRPTAAGAGDGEINLVQLEPGRIRIYPELSRIVTSQFGASAVLSIGTRAFKAPVLGKYTC